jgi:hypothetical protein
VVLALVAAQLADVAGNALVPPARLEAHFDHLGVPLPVRRALPFVKVATSAGLLAGLRYPRLGAVTAVSVVGFYAAAVRFHVGAGDHPVVAAPAAALGAGAALALWIEYFPAVATSRR